MKVMTLRLSDELHTKLKAEAAREGRSLHGLILRLLQEVVGRHDREDKADDNPLLRRGPLPLGADTVVIPRVEVAVQDNVLRRHADGSPADVLRLECTCGAGEKAKGKHNRYCPLRGK